MVIPEKPRPKVREALLAELDLHKTEFSSLREEILQWLEGERQYLSLNLVTIGAGFGLLPFLQNPRVYIVLLLFPLIFHVLLWEMLTSLKSVTSISNYLLESLIPRVNEILDHLGIERGEAEVLGWEMRSAHISTKTGSLLIRSIMPTRHWVPILAVAALLIAYGLLVNDQNYMPSPVEIILVFINLALLILAAVQNLRILRSNREALSNIRLKNQIKQVTKR
jgi:hypothetical protein